MRIFNGAKCELSVIFYLSLSRLKNPAGVHRGPDPGVFADMSAKVRKIIGILDRIRVKYLFSAAALLLFAQLVLLLSSSVLPFYYSPITFQASFAEMLFRFLGIVLVLQVLPFRFVIVLRHLPDLSLQVHHLFRRRAIVNQPLG